MLYAIGHSRMLVDSTPNRASHRFLMGLFAYVYYSSIIRDNHVTVGAVMQTVVASLSTQEQVELAKALTGYLAQQGVKW